MVELQEKRASEWTLADLEHLRDSEVPESIGWS
jgi:hypothetical protein